MDTERAKSKLTVKTKIAYGLGNVSVMVAKQAPKRLCFPIYNIALGVNAAWIGALTPRTGGRTRRGGPDGGPAGRVGRSTSSRRPCCGRCRCRSAMCAPRRTALRTTWTASSPRIWPAIGRSRCGGSARWAPFRHQWSGAAILRIRPAPIPVWFR